METMLDTLQDLEDATRDRFATSHDGVRIRYRVEGPSNAPALVLLNSIGTDLSLWNAVTPFLPQYRLLRMDTRGHGLSDAPEGDYSLPMLASDVIDVLDDATISEAWIAGVSLGGMIAMTLALEHPERVLGIVPVCTSAAMDRSSWDARVRKVRAEGTGSILDLAMSRFMSPDFIRAHPDVAGHVAAGLTEMEDRGYAGCGAAIRDMRIIQRLPELRKPTLILAGTLDTSTPFEGHGDRIAAAIPDAEVAHLRAAHLAPLEAAEALALLLAGFIRTHTTGEARPLTPRDLRSTSLSR